MTVAERLHRLLREMTAVERIVCATAIVGSFAIGLVFPSFFLERLHEVLDRTPFAQAIDDRIPFDHPFFIAIVWVLFVGVGLVQFAVIVRLVAFLPSIGMRAFTKLRKAVPFLASPDLLPIVRSLHLFPLVYVKLGTLSAPGAALGCVAAMALGWLGAYETPRGFYVFHAFYASQSFLGAIVGIAVILYTPEYRHALPRLIDQVRRFLKRQVFVGQAIRSCDQPAG